MLTFLKNLLQPRDDFYGVPRSGRWPKVRETHLENNPACAVCESKKNVVVHHIKPFHLHPDLELDPSNLITLCENEPHHCHLLFGHLMCFRSYNPKVEEDVKEWNKKINDRPS